MTLIWYPFKESFDFLLTFFLHALVDITTQTTRKRLENDSKTTRKRHGNDSNQEAEKKHTSVPAGNNESRVSWSHK